MSDADIRHLTGVSLPLSHGMRVETTGRYTFGTPVHSICFKRRSFRFELK